MKKNVFRFSRKLKERLGGRIRNRSQRRLLISKGLFGGWLNLRVDLLRSELLKHRVTIVPTEECSRMPPPRPEATLSSEELRQLALYPACIESELTVQELSQSPEREQVIQKWQGFLAQEANVIGSSFAQLAPTEVAIVQGYETLGALARLIAIKQGIPVMAFENTALNNRLLWDDHSGITTNRNLAANYYWREIDHTSSQKADEYCEKLIATTKLNKTEQHQSPSTKIDVEAISGPIVLFLGQVYTDSSILFGLAGWISPIQIIRSLLRMSVSKKFTLIVKLHPKEGIGNAPITEKPYNNMTYRKMMADEEIREHLRNEAQVIVDHDNRFDTYSLIDSSDAVVTINSQAGLEAAIRGNPPILCGSSFYGGLGFTHEATMPHLLETQLDYLLGRSAERNEEEKRVARKFTYIFFEKYCLPKEEKAVASCIARRMAR